MVNTKKNLLKIMGLGLILPLLMSNSPAPQPDINYYNKFESTLISVQDNTYTFDIKNVGEDKALLINNYYMYLNNADLFKNDYTYSGVLFTQEVFYPSETKTITFTFENPTRYQIKETDNKFRGIYYKKVDPEIVPTNLSISKCEDKTYELNGDFGDLRRHYYDAIVDVTYNGKQYGFALSLDRNRRFTTLEDLDLTKLVINGLTVYRSTYTRPIILENLGQILGIVFLVCLGINILIVPPAIIIPVSIVKSRRRRRREAASK